MFSACYNAARYKRMCQYRSEPRWKVLESRICVETATHSLSAPTNLLYDIEQVVVTSDVGATSSKNSQSKNRDCDVSSDDEKIGRRAEYVFEAAELNLNVWRLANSNLTGKLLQLLSCLKLTSEDYISSLPNIERCEDFINKRDKEKCLSIEMAPANISISGSDKVVENLTLLL